MKISKEECVIIRKKLEQIGGFCWVKFNYCNAYTTNDYISFVIGTEHDTANIQPIRSYNTIVGFADLTNGVVYECGKYSTTTSKQFTQIFNSIYYKKGFTRELAYR